jgi:hypothetical protein
MSRRVYIKFQGSDEIVQFLILSSITTIGQLKEIIKEQTIYKNNFILTNTTGNVILNDKTSLEPYLNKEGTKNKFIRVIKNTNKSSSSSSFASSSSASSSSSSSAAGNVRPKKYSLEEAKKIINSSNTPMNHIFKLRKEELINDRNMQTLTTYVSNKTQKKNELISNLNKSNKRNIDYMTMLINTSGLSELNKNKLKIKYGIKK